MLKDKLCYKYSIYYYEYLCVLMIIFTFILISIINGSTGHCAHFPLSLEICVLIIANRLKQAKLNLAEIPFNKMLNATLSSCFEFLAHFSLWVCNQTPLPTQQNLQCNLTPQ